MKNFKNYAMALVALAIAATTVAATGLKKVELVNDPYYPMVNGVYQSTPLDPSKEGNLEDGWDCLTEEETICSAQFSSAPSPTNQTPDGNIREGQFEDHSSN